jgi:sialate O-acetylesterase
MLPLVKRSLRRLQSSATLAILLGLMLCGSLNADVKLPEIFGDHMVLQRDTSVPVWGWADPGETVTVAAGTDKATAVAGADGKWSLKLEKLAASAEPIEVTISGKNSITLHDVLVGDVWVCSGQSNMEYGIRAFISKDELAQANEPQIRLFAVPKCVAPNPAEHIAPAPADAPLLGKWQVCTPDTICKDGEWSGFSGVGYYFGHEIHAYTHQPG